MEPISKAIANGIKYPIRGGLPPKQNDSQTRSMPTTTEGKLLKHKPLIIPREIPIQTMSRILDTNPPHEAEEYQTWARHLDSYQRTGMQWDEYAKKIPGSLRNLWRDIQRECRRNGFLGPVAVLNREGQYRIIFHQVVDIQHKVPVPEIIQADLCSMCERFCKRRDSRGVFFEGSGPCWKK